MNRAKNPFFKMTTPDKALKMGPRKFVKDYLFPAMRREHGQGFSMAIWTQDVDADSVQGLDGIYDRKVPACRSVMCIGGTMQAILGDPRQTAFANILGIENDAAVALFYHWSQDQGPWAGLSLKFHAAKTPAQKERVAEKAVLAAIRIGEQRREGSRW